MKKLFLVLTTALTLAACTISPADEVDLAGDYSDVEKSAIERGKAPVEFNLSNPSGDKVSLADTLQQHNVMVIFYRGDWCPYCIDQFSTIQPVLPQLKQHNIKLLAISPDDLSAAKNTQRKFGQDYTFLSDASLEVTKAYGIGSEKDLPHPAVFLMKQASSIEKSEIVWRYVSSDHTVRPNGEQLLEQIKVLFPIN